MSRVSKLLAFFVPFALLLMPMGIGSAAAPQATAKPLKVLVIAAQGPAAVIDPQFSNSYQTREIVAHAFDTLVSFNEKFAIIPNLAASWKMKGGGTGWTFTIAKGVKFQDGENLVAEDVVASITRYMKYGVGGSGFSANIFNVTAPSKYVVNITLKTANPNFLVSLANPLTFIAIMPRKFANTSTTALSPPNLIGTGPYRITAWVPDQYTELTLNKKYTPPNKLKASGYGGNRTGTIPKIRYQVILAAQTRAAGVQTGEYQYAEALPFDTYGTLQKSKSTKPVLLDPYTKSVFYPNMWSGPLTNVWMRRAILAAINDDAIMKIIVGGNKKFYRLDSSIFFPQQKTWYDPNAGKGIYNKPNLTTVKDDLNKAGYHGEEVTILTNQDFPAHYASATTLAAQLQAAGINAKINLMTWTQQLTYLTKKEGWSLFTSGNSLRFDPSVYSSQFVPGGSLNFGYNSPDMQAAMAAGLGTGNIKQRQAAYKKVQRLVWTEGAEIQIGDYKQLDGMSRKLQGFRPWYTSRFWIAH